MALKAGDPVADKSTLSTQAEGTKIVINWPDDQIVRGYSLTYRNGYPQCGPVNMNTVATFPTVKIGDASTKDGGTVSTKPAGDVKVVK